MNIVWLSWKDRTNPHAGGAELVSGQLMDMLVKDGHSVHLITSSYKDARPEAFAGRFRITRMGGQFSVYLKAFLYYRKNLRGWPDLVIDEMNTLPFFARFYSRTRTVSLCYQLCREIWFYQLVFPINLAGFLLEPLYIQLLRGSKILTESQSTRKDMVRYGLNSRDISIFKVGIPMRNSTAVKEIIKYTQPTLLSLGSIRPMKRTDHQIRAFEKAKRSIPDLQLKIAGNASGDYGKKVLRTIERSRYKNDIAYLGQVSDKEKLQLMQKSHFILVTSVKEGWGLIVTEAASQGTPAIAYDVDGLRDSVKNGETGYVCGSNPNALASTIADAFLASNYEILSMQAVKSALDFTVAASYSSFLKQLG